MKQVHSIAVSIFALAALAACSDQAPITGVPNEVSARHDVQIVTQTVCSGEGNGWVVTPKNPTWAAAVGASSWVGKTATSSTNYTRSAVDAYTSSFTIPSGATGISISGKVLVDNDVTIAVNGNARFYSTFPGAGDPPPTYVYPVGLPDNRTFPNFTTVGGNSFGTSAGFTTGNNTVTFTVYNDDNKNPPADNNPSGLSFCYDVSYTPAPPVTLIPMFVIGDVEPHAVGDNVNFWGAQWWKNNFMSGVVSNGVASFKGYATEADLVCGGTWVSRPGNSSNPPDVIDSRIAVIVTTKVLKQGPNISGDIQQIVLVDQDGGYGPNPGHAGNGKVASVSCTRQ